MTGSSSGWPRERFVNEATNYHDLNKAFRTIDSATGTHAPIPAWMVVDGDYVAR